MALLRLPVTLLTMVFAASGCAANSHYDQQKPHHTRSGFQNNYPHKPLPNLGDMVKWRWQARKLSASRHTNYQPTTVKPDLDLLNEHPSNPSITWLGHATFLLQMGGLNILTDPHLTERASPLSWMGPARYVPPAISLAELPHIDLVVISHNHYDHLDRATVVHLNAQAGGPPRFFVPLALAAWFNAQGISEVIELDWWESRQSHGIGVHFVPAQHWSTRTRLDRNKTLWGGWILEVDEFRFYFAGDTGYSQDFADIGARFAPIDLAAIPIGAYEPRWFMNTQHVNPIEAVRIHRDVGARYSVGMHWGTFVLTDEPLDEPPRELQRARDAAGIAASHFFLMDIGETRYLDELTSAD